MLLSVTAESKSSDNILRNWALAASQLCVPLQWLYCQGSHSLPRMLSRAWGSALSDWQPQQDHSSSQRKSQGWLCTNPSLNLLMTLVGWTWPHAYLWRILGRYEPRPNWLGGRGDLPKENGSVDTRTRENRYQSEGWGSVIVKMVQSTLLILLNWKLGEMIYPRLQ